MVRMSEQSDLSPDKSLSNRGFNINPLDIAKYLLANWYWFLLSVAIFGGIAWYKYATTQYQYSSSAAVMFRDAKTQARAAGLERLARSAWEVNVTNEILQFRSPRLMHDAIWRLHAEVSYTVMDYLRVKELYTQAPVNVAFLDATDTQECSLNVTVIDDQRVEISNLSSGNSGERTATIGKTFKTPFGKMLITKTLFFNKSWYGRTIKVQKMDVNTLAARLGSGLSIRQASADEDYGAKSSSILNMSLKDVSPDRAADVLNMLITIYNEETIEDKNKSAINTSNFINERLVIIAKELGGVESQLESYRLANNMINLQTEMSTSLGQREEYSQRAKDLSTQARMGQSMKNILTDPSKATELIPTGTGLADAGIEAQIQRYNTTMQKRDKLLEGSSDKNPVVADLNKSLSQMKQSIIRSVDNMNANTQTRLQDISSRAGQANARAYRIPTQQRQMLSIERQQRIKEELYLYLLNKREENALNMATTETNARILSAARPSGRPVSPGEKSVISKGVLAGLAVPAAILLFMLFFDTRIKSRKDIEDSVSIPFIGEIPKYSRKKEKDEKQKSDIVVLSNGRDVVSEAFRIVRTNMDFMRVKSKTMQVITFSSFGSGSGKTFVSSNLAASFAQMGKKVILIDLDIRKGTLSARTHHHRAKGMTTFLAGQATLDEIIQKNSL